MPTSPNPLSLNPVVVLTGASSGIGRATALAFARRGAHLVLAARSQAALDAVATECEELTHGAHGTRTLVVPTDVTDADAVAALAGAAIAHFGRIDVWVNNVGVGAVGLFDAVPMAAHRRVLEANLLGHMHGAHAVLPHFRARERGTLVNMISMGGWVPAPFAGAYIASKFGLRGFSETLRAELSGLPDVHVCEVYPTFVDTPGVSHGANYTGRSLRPPPPLVNPRRVADAVVALALARRPRAVTSVGAPALPGRIVHALAPGLLGRASMWALERAIDRGDAAEVTDGNLFAPSRGHEIDGGWRKQNAITAAPLAAAAVGALGMAWWLARRLR